MTALHWTLEGKHKRGRPKHTWRRIVEGEIKTMNNTWGQSKDGQGQTEMEDLCCCPTCERHIGQ